MACGRVRTDNPDPAISKAPVGKLPRSLRGLAAPRCRPTTCAPVRRLGLFHRRLVLVPTWRGLLLLLALSVLSGWLAVHHVYDYLAPNDPAPDDVLVVEGWAPDYMLEAALAEFRRGKYRGLYVTGTPIETGALLAEYGTLAHRSAAVLLRLGAEPAQVHAVPAPQTRQDRTFTMARTLRDHLAAGDVHPVRLNVISLGPHARRTRLLYQKAFGAGVKVGIVAVPPDDFEPARWWTSSSGVRAVISESVAWIYARFFFRAGRS